MSKLQIGDYVYVDYLHKNGTVIGDRGGHVGRWLVRLDSGETNYTSSRNCVVIKPAREQPWSGGRLSTDQKLDILLEYLGLEIKDEPRVIKRVNREKTSNKKR